MLFNSVPFLLFFPIVTIAYFLSPHRLRWALLLAASCVFYMWFIPQYLLVLFLLIIIDYVMGILIEDARLKGMQAEKYLIVSVVATCFVLFLFKYFNFFSSSFSSLAGFLGLHYPPKLLNLIMPIGLSFHTLQSLSYVIEVYKGRQKAERHMGIYALYVMFFPQLLAGPIERPYNLIPQLKERHYIDYQRIADALKLMVWGMFKKVVIADRLAVLVGLVFGDVRRYQGPELALAEVLFAIQIYCDFSGYSDIAVGSAKAMGIRLTNNFYFPYFSRSIDELWRRWNISFINWLRDYIYFPLCQTKILRNNRAVNVLITFLLSGLWHGAAWTYVVWGVANGILLVFSWWMSNFKNRIHRLLGLDEDNFILKIWQVTITFLLFCLVGVFFRAESMEDAFYFFSRLPNGWGHGLLERCSLGFDPQWWTTSVELLAALFFLDLLQKNAGSEFIFARAKVWERWAYYYGLVLAMVFLGNYGRDPFIYFQF
jgi:D-alanyl-lipoteichoic acid acyltransferase DltB (MBOAT superfamily)